MTQPTAPGRRLTVSTGSLRTDVHYVEHGPTDGPTVVLLHGFEVDHRILTAAFEPVFASRPGWRRLYLDLPGMGETPAPPELRSTQDVFEVVRAAVDALVGERPYAVIGQSYGGHLARGLAAVHGERVHGVALVCPVVVPDHAARDLPPRQVLHRDKALLDRVGAEVLDADEINVIQDERVWQRSVTDVEPGLAAADPEALARIAADYAGSFPTEGQRPLEAPVLFLLGRQDSVTGYRDAWSLIERYPHATLAVVDRAGHNLQVEQQGLFEALAHEWLDRVELYASTRVRVRRAEEPDLASVLEIGHLTWWATYPPIAGDDYVRRGLERWWTPESTLPGLRAGRVLLAELGGRAVGMASYSADEETIDLWKLYVIPDAQRSGAGSALLQAVVAAATTQRRVRLAHKDGNARARAFYERHDFVETHRSPDELGGPDNVWMELALPTR